MELRQVLTLTYELQIESAARLRTRIDELYNFREGRFLRFQTNQKVNFKAIESQAFSRFN